MAIRVKINQDAVQKVLAKRNMSQNMLAIKTGISCSYISNIMCGVRYPSPEYREKLLNVLQPLTFDDIFIIEEGHKNDSKS
jgi:transcriptional regulator with XRE-family HTH domain